MGVVRIEVDRGFAEDRFDGRRMADALEKNLRPQAFKPEHVQTIETAGFFFLATAHGQAVDCSFKGGPLVGRQLKELRAHSPRLDTRIVAMFRGDRSVLPEGDTPHQGKLQDIVMLALPGGEGFVVTAQVAAAVFGNGSAPFVYLLSARHGPEAADPG